MFKNVVRGSVYTLSLVYDTYRVQNPRIQQLSKTQSRNIRPHSTANLQSQRKWWQGRRWRKTSPLQTLRRYWMLSVAISFPFFDKHLPIFCPYICWIYQPGRRAIYHTVGCRQGRRWYKKTVHHGYLEICDHTLVKIKEETLFNRNV